MEKTRLSLESLSVTSFHTTEAQPAEYGPETGIMTYLTMCYVCPVKQPGTIVSGAAE